MHQRGGVLRFSVEIICDTVSKIFVGEQFGVSENFVYRKIFCLRRGYHSTPLKNLCLTVPINSWENTYVLQKNSGMENFQAKKVEASRFCRQCFYLTGPKISVFQKTSGREKFFMDEGGGVSCHDFSSKSFCLTLPKCFIGEQFGVSEISLMENRRGRASRFCRNFLSHRTEIKLFVKEPFCFPENC